MSAYRTVRAFSSDEFTEKRSRFIGYARPVKTVAEAAAFIAEIKQKHWDATHNVSAYILREGGIKRYSDDGEPQGTAGVPVLDVLEKEHLTDCAVVVTRYFGGTLLGAGGLVRAYSHGAKLAVEAGGIITMALCSQMLATCDYNFYGRLAALIPECGGTVDDTEFTDAVHVHFHIPEELESSFCARLVDVSNGRFSAVRTGACFMESAAE